MEILVQAYKHARLMEESESRVQMAACFQTPADLVAARILESRDAYQRWTAEHDALLAAFRASTACRVRWWRCVRWRSPLCTVRR
jgi:hypothetical protein